MRYILKTSLGYFASTGWSNIALANRYTQDYQKATLYKTSAAIKGLISHAYRRSKIYAGLNIDWNSVEIISVEIAMVSKTKFTPKDK